MKRVRLIALTMALCWTIPFVAADEKRWYQVDLVVFRYTNNTSGELWPALEERHLPRNIIHLHTADGDSNSDDEDEGDKNIAYVSLPEQQMLLNDQARALGQKRDYQVLTQRAWRMPVSEKGYPVAIEASIEGPEPVSLDGTVIVTLERFLHVEVDLWLNKLAPAPILSDQELNDQDLSVRDLNGQDLSVQELNDQDLGIQDNTFAQDDIGESDILVKSEADSPSMLITENFQLKQRRRIKNSKQVHYLDSPEIGVLIKLTPV